MTFETKIKVRQLPYYAVFNASAVIYNGPHRLTPFKFQHYFPNLQRRTYLNLMSLPLRFYKRFICYSVNRGCYMSVHALLNLLNELGKRDKM